MRLHISGKAASVVCGSIRFGRHAGIWGWNVICRMEDCILKKGKYFAVLYCSKSVFPRGQSPLDQVTRQSQTIKGCENCEGTTDGKDGKLLGAMELGDKYDLESKGCAFPVHKP